MVLYTFFQALVLLSLPGGSNLPWSTAQSEADLLRLKEACDYRALSAELGMPEVSVTVPLIAYVSITPVL